MKNPKFLLSSLLCGGTILIATAASAQLVSGNVFLQADFVEAGIKSNGAFGAPSQPTGYHGNVGTSLGFISDPDMDGWATGTPAFHGDYFMPGTPFEGWAIQRGTLNGTAYGHTLTGGGFTGLLSGSNTGYTSSGGFRTGTWEGMFDSIKITQVTTLDSSSLFFTMKITYTNMSSVDKDDIYYLRTVDPDNDQPWLGGSYVTDNIIDYQLPNMYNASAVSAKGTTHTNMYLALGTADTNAKSFIYSRWPLDSTTDLRTIFDETFTADYTAGDSVSGDVAIGLAFRVGHLAPLDSAGDSVAYRTTAVSTPGFHAANEYSFTYFYAFSKAARDTAIAHTAMVHGTTMPTLAVNNVNAGTQVNIYPNPTKDVVNITGLSNTDKIAVYDLMGREAGMKWTAKAQAINTFSTGSLAAGHYVVVVTDATGTVRSRVAVQKQ